MHRQHWPEQLPGPFTLYTVTLSEWMTEGFLCCGVYHTEGNKLLDISDGGNLGHGRVRQSEDKSYEEEMWGYT